MAACVSANLRVCTGRRDAGAVATSSGGSAARLASRECLAFGASSLECSTSLPDRRRHARAVTVSASRNDDGEAAEGLSRRQALAAAAATLGLAMQPQEAQAFRTTTFGTYEDGTMVKSEWNRIKARPGAASTYTANLANRTAFTEIVADKVKAAFKPEEAPQLVKLMFLDASTYKPVNYATYGMNGSIRFEEELIKSEGLTGAWTKLQKVKSDVDVAYASYAKDLQARQGDKTSPGPDKMSFTDLIGMSAAVVVEQKWESERGVVEDSLKLHWPNRQGRTDASEADPSERALDLAALGPAGARAAFKKQNMNIFDLTLLLNEMMGPDGAAAFCEGDADCTEALQQVASMPRRTYERKFIDTYTRYASLGVDFDPMMYLFDVKDPNRTSRGIGGL